MDNTRGQFLLMPVEAADDAFFDCPGAALLLSRLYNARCYQSGRVTFSLRSEGEGIRSRKALGKWWQELKRINDELGEPFFDPETIERHGREGMSVVLKQHSKTEQVRPVSSPRQHLATQWQPNQGGSGYLATQQRPKSSSRTTVQQSNPDMATHVATPMATQREPNMRLLQEISNSGINNNSLASKQASPPARESENENVTATPIQQASGHTQPQASEQSPPPASQHTHQRVEQTTQPPAVPPDDLERRTIELTGFARLPQHWVRQLEEWRLARYPDRAVARVFEWAWEVKASEGRVPGRGAMTKTLRAIAQEKEEEQREHERVRVRTNQRTTEQREPESLAELKRRVRAERAGFA